MYYVCIMIHINERIIYVLAETMKPNYVYSNLQLALKDSLVHRGNKRRHEEAAVSLTLPDSWHRHS